MKTVAHAMLVQRVNLSARLVPCITCPRPFGFPIVNLSYDFVDVIVTSECIHLCILCLVPRCLFWDVIESCHAPMFRPGGSIM